MSEVHCREALARIFEYLDGELAAGSADEIRAHFERCQSCYPRLRYATASVTRAQSNRGAVGGGGSFGGGQSDDAWAPSAPAAQSGGGDVWNTPGTSYGDETPF